MPVERVQLGDREIVLVGTAHVSRTSVEEVRATLAETGPDVVAVELCQSRYDVLKNPRQWQETDILKVIREKKAPFLFANLVLASFQRRIGEKLGVRPGEEMRVAVEEAESGGIPVALIDREVRVTLQRAWRKLTCREKLKLVWFSLTSVLVTEDLGEEDIERFKEKDVLTAAVEEIGQQAPTVKRVLLDERDAYMARKLLDIEAGKVLAVVGAGHVQGLIRRLRDPVEDVDELETVPPKGRGLWKWIIPVLILVLVGLGFVHGGADRGYQMLKWWVASNALFAALGALVAFAHPVSILVAAVASPITSLNPALAAGWFAGLSEAYLRRPGVADFEAIHEDMSSVRGMWRNSITRILLVVILANLGSSLGAYVAMPILTRIVLGG